MARDDLKRALGERWEEYVERREHPRFLHLKGRARRQAVLSSMGLDVGGVAFEEAVVAPMVAEEKVGVGRKFRRGEDDISWIYRSLSDSGVMESDAPSMGAWGWLEAIREDKGLKSDFYKTIWTARVREEQDARKKYGDDGKDILNRVEKLLGKYVRGEND